MAEKKNGTLESEPTLSGEEMKVGKRQGKSIHYTIGWMKSAIQDSIRYIEEERYESALHCLKRADEEYKAYYRTRYGKEEK